MRDDEPGSPSELRQRIRFLLQQPLDFTSPDLEKIEAAVRVLVAAATYFNVLVVQEFGGRLGVARDPGLVEQVVSAAFQTFGSHDPHPDVFQKAAMLLRGITAGHPFNDGNKRTGFLVAAYYLAQVGVPESEVLVRGEATDAAEALCLQISAGQLRDIDTIASELRRLWDQ